MVAVGPAAVGTRRERLPPSQLRQVLRAGTRLAQERLATARGEHVEHAGAHQKRPQVAGQLGQHGPRQVCAGERRAPVERGDGAPSLGQRVAPRGQVEHVQAGRPAADPAGQRGGVIRRQRLPVDIAQEVLHLPGPEAQLLAVQDPNLEQFVARQVEAGHAPPGGEDVQPRRGSGDNRLQHRLGLRTGQAVGVVDDQQRVRGARGAQAGQQRLQVSGRFDPDQRRRRPPEVAHDTMHRGVGRFGMPPADRTVPSSRHLS